MLKKPITFQDPLSGDVVTQEYYFNLTKAECMELQLSEAGGWAESMESMLQDEDRTRLVMAIKDIILRSYGIRLGGEFFKTPESARAFATSEAYSVLFMELLTDVDAGVEFFKGVMPADLMKGLDLNPDEEPKPATPVAPKKGQMTRAELIEAMRRRQRGWPKELTYEEVVDMSQEDLDEAMAAGCTVPTL